ncbi:hypothetical protein LTR35_007843 [Friedmanniomyces endolithicus]|uniref:Phytanoyl-CoA dioxygenase n=1 Tax=Friedmanniomyces endolithicus TaxID=329885 RepID=A0A4U0UKH2_9PEZI|nr:hypothetical protein LTS09_001509 [Friedmanniomyces endolithicus]KAK0280816.1 hypothetical protein LTR35_007843 [Friedmanniomyces endolithicus]KAK0304503.1 hypothetical protein LTR01_007296 [Friedmanniomyces endolithicus]KAK0826647.1 hypothetical protein LTR73_005981 [Friedmanniomyces endolithicus]TKA35205.1 hypothetical protein B0A54_12480 [Friedmanniomyces endolithicus]
MSHQSTPLPPATELRASLARDGFVRIPNALPPSDLARFRTAAQHATARARAGQWPFVRTVPKQFPPWPVSEATTEGIWGVQHLLHPSMPAADRRVFAESYFGGTMVAAVTALLDCREEELVMELYNMLVCPPKDFALRWHRDDIGPDVAADVELERLREPLMHAQWNLALYPDSSLVVVPGSHRRPRTEEERKADPYEDNMPGQVHVSMEAGDIVFYNNNILHRGVYDCKAERMTLHGTMGLSGADPARSRNILQHGIGDWAAECDFGDLPGEMVMLARGMQRRLMGMGMGNGRGVGFSQQD